MMTAPLIFVRDERTLPFVPVTLEALAAIATAAPARRLAYARSLYIALLEIANASRGRGAHASRRAIGELAGCSREMVSDLRAILEEAGVVRVEERYAGAQRLENEWVILEPESPHPVPTRHDPLPARHDPRAHEAQLSKEAEETEPNGSVRRSRSTPLRVIAEPTDDKQRRIVGELRRFADGKAASLDEVKALRACEDFPEPDHVGEAEKFARWHLEGKGAGRRRSDTNAAWRNWLGGADPAPAPGTAPVNGARRSFEFSRGPSAFDDMEV